MRFAMLFVALVAGTSAQDAIVVDISPHDTALISDLYAKRDALNKEIDEERNRIGLKYATWGGSTSIMLGTGQRVPPDYAFSSDFKHIVPNLPKDAQVNGWPNGCIRNTLTGVL